LTRASAADLGDEEQFIAEAFRGDSFQPRGFRERGKPLTIGQGGGVVAAEDDRAQGEVNFMDEAGLEDRGIDFATAFAEQAPDFPFSAQPAECVVKINLRFAANFHLVRKGAKLAQFGAGAGGGEDDDGGKAVPEDFGLWVEGTGAADDDAEIEFGEAGAEALTAVFRAAGAEFDGGKVHGARAGHDGVRDGAEFEEVTLVAAAAEGDEMAAGGGELAVRRDGGVHKNEGQGAGMGAFHDGQHAGGRGAGQYQGAMQLRLTLKRTFEISV
jgi:hypothetical protein